MYIDVIVNGTKIAPGIKAGKVNENKCSRTLLISGTENVARN